MWFNHMVLTAHKLKLVTCCNFYCHAAKMHNVFPSAWHLWKGWSKFAPVLVPPSSDLRQAEPGAAPELDLSPKTSTDWATPALSRNQASRKGLSSSHHGTGLASTTNSNIFPTGLKIYTEKTTIWWPEHNLIKSGTSSQMNKVNIPFSFIPLDIKGRPGLQKVVPPSWGCSLTTSGSRKRLTQIKASFPSISAGFPRTGCATPHLNESFLWTLGLNSSEQPGHTAVQGSVITKSMVLSPRRHECRVLIQNYLTVPKNHISAHSQEYNQGFLGLQTAITPPSLFCYSSYSCCCCNTASWKGKKANKRHYSQFVWKIN